MPSADPERDRSIATISIVPPESGPPEGSSGTPVPPRGAKKRSQARKPGSGGSGGRATGGGGRAGSAERGSAAQRAATTRRAAVAAERRRRNTLLAVGAIGVVIVVVAVLVIVKATGTTKSTTAASTTAAGIYQPLSAAQYKELTSVAPATLAAAAKDYHDPGAEIALSYPQPVKGPSYLVDGKPGGFYMGAEYCPYCATERWPLVIALSKFGTWSGLETMKSSGTDVFPDTPTMTFLHATYVSKYFGFEHWELETRDYKTLQTPSAKAQSLFNKYNLQGGIPFVYLDGKYLINEVEYSPQYLRTGGGTHTDGISFDSALSSIAGATSTLAANVEADAGAITADICQITHGQPGSVCKYFPKAITSKDATPGDLAANSGSG